MPRNPSPEEVFRRLTMGEFPERRVEMEPLEDSERDDAPEPPSGRVDIPPELRQPRPPSRFNLPPVYLSQAEQRVVLGMRQPHLYLYRNTHNLGGGFTYLTNDGVVLLRPLDRESPFDNYTFPALQEASMVNGWLIRDSSPRTLHSTLMHTFPERITLPAGRVIRLTIYDE